MGVKLHMRKQVNKDTIQLVDFKMNYAKEAEAALEPRYCLVCGDLLKRSKYCRVTQWVKKIICNKQECLNIRGAMGLLKRRGYIVTKGETS